MSGFAIFAAGLTAPERRPPAGLAGPSERRFAVYRNNVAVGLIRALETRFPAVRSLVGEEFFGAMARDFIRSHPPASPVLAGFGDELPGFLAGFEPAADLPYLADIARIEAARTRAYHAADLARLDASVFAALPPDALERLRITLHPAATVVRSIHPVWDILAAASGAGDVTEWTPQAVLIDRPHLDVVMRPLPVGTAAFLAALAADAPLGDAATSASAADPAFNPTAALLDLIGGALAIQIHLPEESLT
ncbi:putative DNA-binding domain-containing protein [Starkeya koreensis]|uniref:DNA-binding domain-containing protein n=1 Tax=Ancylobacter koreensis TaxID=266121 RepID=A0ABT0DRJ9_9HYPH|nr:DNA-binding domain-containing protein [Ancylobacter koreensis]MCK0209747.1 putative DNA-binding domain-containing protein [Ancylobacter koreensis]